MNIQELRDLVVKARKVKSDDIKGAPSSENQSQPQLPDTPGHTGPNTVTGKGGGGILGDSWQQNQY